MRLRCRTPAEAYLVSKELESADIIAIVPEPKKLLWEYKRNGYVEVQVSARVYGAEASLPSVVEFDCKRLQAERPLPCFEKVTALVCGILVGPGWVLCFVALCRHLQNGQDRMAVEFTRWFLIGFATGVLVLCGLRALLT